MSLNQITKAEALTNPADTFFMYSLDVTNLTSASTTFDNLTITGNLGVGGVTTLTGQLNANGNIEVANNGPSVYVLNTETTPNANRASLVLQDGPSVAPFKLQQAGNGTIMENFGAGGINVLADGGNINLNAPTGGVLMTSPASISSGSTASAVLNITAAAPQRPSIVMQSGSNGTFVIAEQNNGDASLQTFGTNNNITFLTAGTGVMLFNTFPILYSTRGAFTQITSSTTSVATTGTSFVVTTYSTSPAVTLAPLTTNQFTLTNPLIITSSVIQTSVCAFPSFASGGFPLVYVVGVTSGSCIVTIQNVSATAALTMPLGISFLIT